MASNSSNAATSTPGRYKTIARATLNRVEIKTYLKLLREYHGTMKKALNDIENYVLTAPNIYNLAVMAAEHPDQRHLQVLNAKERVMYKHIAMRERWVKEDYKLHADGITYGSGEKMWPTVQTSTVQKPAAQQKPAVQQKPIVQQKPAAHKKPAAQEPAAQEATGQEATGQNATTKEVDEISKPLWHRVFFDLHSIELRDIRNTFAHNFHDTTREDTRNQELRSVEAVEANYLMMVPLFRALIDKLQAGLDDPEGWWGAAGQSRYDGPVKDYMKDFPEAEAAWEAVRREQETRDGSNAQAPVTVKPGVKPKRGPLEPPNFNGLDASELVAEPESDDRYHGGKASLSSRIFTTVLKPKFTRRLAVRTARKLGELQGDTPTEEWVQKGRHRYKAPVTEWKSSSEAERCVPVDATAGAEVQDEEVLD